MPKLASQASSPSRPHSLAAFAQARGLMPGGVNSPVRAYQAVADDQHPGPIFIRRANGAIVTDVDGQDYVDYVGSYGPLILGHAHDAVVAALTHAATCGSSFGMPTLAESQLAQLVIDAVPSIDLVRFVNSGTEAVMSAIRLARAATGRPGIIKCIGCYHGHSDSLLVKAGSGLATLGVGGVNASSAGVPDAMIEHTLLAPYNDLQAMRRLIEQHPGDVACIIIEPVAGNMGCVPPGEPASAGGSAIESAIGSAGESASEGAGTSYLQSLRNLCDEHGVLLIFDEVMTGFRVAYGGAQQRFAVTPDLTCLGKIVGGGLPCAAYGGREDLMRQIAPDGPVYQAGTLSGNPLAMAAGIATLQALQEPGLYDALEKTSAALAQGLETAAAQAQIPVRINRVGSMLSVFFTDQPVIDYATAATCNADRFAAFFRTMLDHGVVLPPSQFETWFVSTAHDESTIQHTLTAAQESFAKVSRRL